MCYGTPKALESAKQGSLDHWTKLHPSNMLLDTMTQLHECCSIHSLITSERSYISIKMRSTYVITHAVAVDGYIC